MIGLLTTLIMVRLGNEPYMRAPGEEIHTSVYPINSFAPFITSPIAVSIGWLIDAPAART